MGYIGSDSGTQLSNFMSENAGLPSVVLLDEFDHCDPETWEAFYHIFDEGMYVLVRDKDIRIRKMQYTFFLLFYSCIKIIICYYDFYYSIYYSSFLFCLFVCSKNIYNNDNHFDNNDIEKNH